VLALQAASARPLQADTSFFSAFTAGLAAGAGAGAGVAAGALGAAGAGASWALAVATNSPSEAVAAATPIPQRVNLLITAVISIGWCRITL
jgi:hypothetical protein